MNIGRSIKVACAQKGIKQIELAEILGLTPITVSRMANNKGDALKKETLESLAGAFNMPVSEFIALGE
jgi:transcriptional regulator with XRE-family HTH domain